MPKKRGAWTVWQFKGELGKKQGVVFLMGGGLYPNAYYEDCCHIWAGAPSYYLELLEKLQKQICKTDGPSLAASLEPLVHH